MREDHPGAITPKRHGFPLWAQQRILDRERLRELLRLQGLSPRKHQGAAIVQAYRCGGGAGTSSGGTQSTRGNARSAAQSCSRGSLRR